MTLKEFLIQMIFFFSFLKENQVLFRVANHPELSGTSQSIGDFDLFCPAQIPHSNHSPVGQ